MLMPRPESQRDYFAELYVAGIFGDAGWSVFFPKRDVGFDFVVSKKVSGKIILRPVQVKGKYPSAAKGAKSAYGYLGALTAVHEDMVLALPFFSATERGAAPELIAYMPMSQINNRSRGGYRCVPATYANGHAKPRKSFEKYFGESGLRLLDNILWA